MAAKQMFAEVEEYRRLMEPPKEYEEGFSIKTVLGALFVAFIMMPGSIYLGLVAGTGLGAAAQWVTVILFVEVARRAFVTMRRQEIYLLVLIAGAVLGTNPFTGFFWNAYLRTSHITKGLGVAEQIPTWVVPVEDSPAILHRTFFHPDWFITRLPDGALFMGPVLLMLFGALVGRVKGFTAGYALFRLTSDYERLPFPFAPVGALGATALAEISRKEETWRWRLFSIGAMVGLAFGFFYIGVPTLTGAVMSRPLQLIKIPFIDLTHNTEHVLPATPTGIATDLGSVLAGFVMPFWSVVGGFIAATMTLILNPILYQKGLLVNWRPGMDTIQTSMQNYFDFWLSAQIGVNIAIFLIGMHALIQSVRASQRERDPNLRRSWTPPKGRGDFALPIILTLYALAALSYVWLCHRLMPAFSSWFVLAFAFLYTPLTSYIDARMIGMVGQWISIPYAREAIFILWSRWKEYKGIDIWFAPIPMADYGGSAQHFRVVELTGTKFISLIKCEVVIVLIGITSNLLISQFIWRLAPIPSYAYPFAQKMWPLNAFYQSLWWTATSKGRDFLLKAIKPPIIGSALGTALAVYILLFVFKLPITLIYGFIRGVGAWPHGAILEISGALIARYYFMKRFDTDTWRRYAAVLLAGYSCGMGLVGMGAAAIAMISKAVSQLPY